jgi:hypothetical protein
MIKRDCYWYHCEHQMGASIDCCTLAKGLGDCPCSDDCDNYISHMEAIERLKAQTPVKAVYSRQYEQDPDIQIYKCGACGKEISAFGFANYCQHCGRKVRWE